MKIQAIQNGVDLAIFYNQDKRSWKIPRILFFNSTNVFKGTHLFLDVLKKLQSYEFELYVVGSSIYSEREVKNLKPIRDRNTMNSLYNEVDILVFPSESENFPLTVIEAMATGVCVIGANTGGIPEQINPMHGCLFESGNTEDLFEKVKYILGKDLTEIRTMGKQASGFVKQYFSFDEMYEKYIQLYKQVLN